MTSYVGFLCKKLEQYKEQWVNEAGQFQKAQMYLTHGETHRCHIIKCLPDELQKKFYDRFHTFIGAPGKAKGGTWW